MAIALSILKISLPGSHIVVLAIVALASSLIPFGRLGFREFCVALTAHRLSMLQSDVEVEMNALALIESAGEMLVFIPLGAIALLWYRKRWMGAGTRVLWIAWASLSSETTASCSYSSSFRRVTSASKLAVARWVSSSASLSPSSRRFCL